MICFNLKPKVEDNLTEFELRKIAEEKLRLKLENEKYEIKPKKPLNLIKIPMD